MPPVEPLNRKPEASSDVWVNASEATDMRLGGSEEGTASLATNLAVELTDLSGTPAERSFSCVELAGYFSTKFLRFPRLAAQICYICYLLIPVNAR